MEIIKLDKFTEQCLKYLFLTLGFFSVFKGVFSWLFKTNIFEYFDEVVFVLSIGILTPLFLFSKKLKIIHFLILIFIFYSIAISLMFGFNSNFLKIVLQSLITLKLFIVLLAFVSLFKNDFGLLRKFFFLLIKFAALGVILHLMFGEKFNYLLGVDTFARPQIRYVGFFTHPNHLAYIMLVAVAYILNKAKAKARELKQSEWIKIVLAVFVIILADSRTALLSVGIFFLAFYWKFIRHNYKILFSVSLAGLIGLILLLSFTDLYASINRNIQDTFDLNSHYVRGNMIYLSGVIVWDFFPIGTGAASFGSLLSDDKVYELYGQSNRYYFVNEIGLYDSNIASIVGEYGLIGIIFFIAFFVYLKRYLISLTPRKDNLVVTFLCVLVFYSITNPILTNNFYVLISSIVLILFVAEENQDNSLNLN